MPGVCGSPGYREQLDKAPARFCQAHTDCRRKARRDPAEESGSEPVVAMDDSVHCGCVRERGGAILPKAGEVRRSGEETPGDAPDFEEIG